RQRTQTPIAIGESALSCFWSHFFSVLQRASPRNAGTAGDAGSFAGDNDNPVGRIISGPPEGVTKEDLMKTFFGKVLDAIVGTESRAVRRLKGKLAKLRDKARRDNRRAFADGRRNAINRLRHKKARRR